MTHTDSAQPTPRFCGGCGAALPDDAVAFCGQCGQPVATQRQVAARDEQAAQGPSGTEPAEIGLLRGGRKRVLGIVAAGVVLATVAIPGVLFATSDEQQPSNPSGGRSWTRVVHDEAVFGGPGRQAMHSVTAGGPGLVAVGADRGRDAAAVWTSPDGQTWSRVTHDETVFGGPGEQSMSSVTAGGPGLVAVGSEWNQVSKSVAAVWTSPDGVTWSRVPHDETVFGGPGIWRMRSVAAGGPGLVAVGAGGAIGEEAARVWTSEDGATWLGVAPDEAVFGGPGRQSMSSVVAAGGLGLVAVGTDGDLLGLAAVWASPDGENWRRIRHDEAVFGTRQQMRSVVTSDQGLVAVGFDVEAGASVVWTSTDGDSWTRVQHDETASGGSQSMVSVVAGGPGVSRGRPGRWGAGCGGVGLAGRDLLVAHPARRGGVRRIRPAVDGFGCGRGAGVGRGRLRPRRAGCGGVDR